MNQLQPIAPLIDIAKFRARGKFYIAPQMPPSYTSTASKPISGNRVPERVSEEEVAAWCRSIGRPIPSEMPPDQRAKLVVFLGSPRGTAMFLQWRRER